MQKKISLRVTPSEISDHSSITNYIAAAAGVSVKHVSGFYPLKRSIDARGKQVWYNLTVLGFINEPFAERPTINFVFEQLKINAPRVVIIGGGPAGLFAALYLLQNGIKPIILERGKDVRARRRDLAILNKEGIINPDSNYCFGEGGAGTYSDGKLYTRSNKRGDINRILQLFVHFGAAENILFDAHPHIGTNKLPNIITSIRKTIEACGGEFHFQQKVTDFEINSSKIIKVRTADTSTFEGDAFILATGHSARDIFELLFHKKILIEAKPFALGVRIEHPQSLINTIQYHRQQIAEHGLPPAAYSLVEQVNKRGVFSFCMCPGGIIAPAATSPGELVVNGWSPSKRNNPYANSGIVVSVEEKDFAQYHKNGALAAMYFQREVEKKAFDAGGGKFNAPAQRMTDFAEKKHSVSLPSCSYIPGTKSVNLNEVLPAFIYNSLREGFKSFGQKMKGYYTSEAIVVATESRTSSPVRIPRDTITLNHPQLCNLYPCGEGAGYAGGIVSAAMDGERVAHIIRQKLQLSQ